MSLAALELASLSCSRKDSISAPCDWIIPTASSKWLLTSSCKCRGSTPCTSCFPQPMDSNGQTHGFMSQTVSQCSSMSMRRIGTVHSKRHVSSLNGHWLSCASAVHEENTATHPSLTHGCGRKRHTALCSSASSGEEKFSRQWSVPSMSITSISISTSASRSWRFHVPLFSTSEMSSATCASVLVEERKLVDNFPISELPSFAMPSRFSSTSSRMSGTFPLFTPFLATSLLKDAMPFT
mmetsp:Transcript_41120/g.96090  ORF Transcript_41120/g.96090 Transcript_41120/m.96090 type:complete len:238 (+) Transcript_41120:1073-1786(+)